ncbi:secreted phosphoprotein 24 isoform X3 [Dromaius novaehollandiae]|uniref:secreted phosphoprotein 24 isoform X3 n=1 Tax=Dromaius novaehollandiae TaxID=8790 RepID=UPI000E1E8254|nr:secreted phosphoprotein 24 isoform X3 [Dromaius novaehollandiae]
MRILIFVLTLSIFSCSGFPVYDYELPVTEEALNASIARINSQSRGPNLYGVVRSHVRSVDMWNSNDYKLVLQFSIRETVCTKISGRDPFTCDFKIGPFVPTAFCRSVVVVSEEQIVNMVVQCHQDMSSSESISSEEVYLLLKPSLQGEEVTAMETGINPAISALTRLNSTIWRREGEIL